MKTEIDYQTRILGTDAGEYLFVDRYSNKNEVWLNANVRGGNTRLVLSPEQAHALIKAVSKILEANQPKKWDGQIRPSDFTVTTFSTQKSGWIKQHDNGIRVTHVPTGEYAESHEHRSQHANREVAWNELKEKLVSMAKTMENEA